MLFKTIAAATLAGCATARHARIQRDAPARLSPNQPRLSPDDLGKQKGFPTKQYSDTTMFLWHASKIIEKNIPSTNPKISGDEVAEAEEGRDPDADAETNHKDAIDAAPDLGISETKLIIKKEEKEARFSGSLGGDGLLGRNLDERAPETRRTSSATLAPTLQCVDDDSFRLNNSERLSCDWVAKKKTSSRCNILDKPTNKKVEEFCLMTCISSCQCKNSRKQFKTGGKVLRCKHIKKRNKKKCQKRAREVKDKNKGENKDKKMIVADFCPKKCGTCFGKSKGI